jgi:hypothetical protein
MFQVLVRAFADVAALLGDRRPPTGAAVPVAPVGAKSGMAIGKGWKVPWVMSTDRAAKAGCGISAAANQQPFELTAQEQATIFAARRPLSGGWRGMVMPFLFISLASDHGSIAGDLLPKSRRRSNQRLKPQVFFARVFHQVTSKAVEIRYVHYAARD